VGGLSIHVDVLFYPMLLGSRHSLAGACVGFCHLLQRLLMSTLGYQVLWEGRSSMVRVLCLPWHIQGCSCRDVSESAEREMHL